MNSYEEVSIVIVSYRSKKKIIKFLKKIYQYKKIIVIENSDDLSIGLDIKRIYKNVEVYHTNNIGYGCSANYARKKINTEYFFLFNPDLQDIDHKIIETFLIQAKKLNNNFSCLGPRYNNISEKTLKQSDISKEIGYVDSISGAAMFFNTKVFDKIGRFDENIFLYFEETDFCKRGRKINLNSFQLNKIKIRHDVGTAVEYIDENEKIEIKLLCGWHFIWSKYYFYKKHYGLIVSLIYFFPILVRSIIKILISKIFKNYSNEEKYKNRINGLIASIKGLKSFKRIE